MDEELRERLDRQERQLQEIQISVEKTRKYILIMVIGSVVLVVLPLILAAFIIPAAMSSYLGALEGL